jgi:hypothetical protein
MPDPKQKNQGPAQNLEGGGHKQDGGGLPPEKSMTPKAQDEKRDEPHPKGR